MIEIQCPRLYVLTNMRSAISEINQKTKITVVFLLHMNFQG